MNKSLILYLIFAIFCSAANIVAKNPISNPITKGLHPYGMRDFQIFVENNAYYLLGTEMAKPGDNKRGVVLYKSHNLSEWTEIALLIDRSKLNPEYWYYDDFKSPKITKIKNKFYLTFSANNFSKNPYGSTGVAVAVSNKIDGPYSILTKEKPLTLGNNFSINISPKNEIIAYWDLDGKIFRASMNDDFKSLKSKPAIAIDQGQLRPDDHFLDAPNLFSYKGTYYLLYSVFHRGYRVSFAHSKLLNGQWKAPADNLVFYRSEDQASTVLKMEYPRENTYAPPCEIIGNAHLFVDLEGKLRIAYHSEDKYSEPFLCVDYAEIIDNKVICNPTLK